MDDTKNTQNIPPAQAQPTAPQQPSQVSVAQQPATSSAPTKEHVSVTADAPSDQVGEYLRPTHPEVNLHPELQQAGVEKAPQHEQPQLTVSDKRSGLEHAKEATPVTTSPTGAVSLPMTQEKATAVVKETKDIRKSLLWYATLLLRQFKKAHRKLLSQ
ncbi:MAG TPA: hypothetical protein VJC10_02245 [Patescibacteria group bacterium]|nr:hypothetical protein [Patescibacteria group bacterium]